MIIVRRGTFETNSSSTHSITMCMESDYEKWKNGELYYFDSNNEFVTKEQRDNIIKAMILKDNMDIDYDAKTITFKGNTISYDNWEDRENKIKSLTTEENLKEITQEEFEEFLNYNFDKYEMPCSYSEYYDDIEYETYKSTFTTPSGERVVSFGYYGQDM